MGTGVTYVNKRAGVDLLTLGEPIVCLDTHGTRIDNGSVLHVALGGAECNVAIGLARLGHTSAVIGRVGADAFGRTARRRLLAEGVDVSNLVVDETAPTAVLFKEQTARGSEVHYRRAGCAGSLVSVADVDALVVELARCVHVTGVTAALGPGPRAAVGYLMRSAREAGARVSFDANLRRKLAADDELVEMFHELCSHADDVLIGWGEAALIAGDDTDGAITAMVAGLERPCVVVKRPSGGAICLENGEWSAHAAFQVAVVDPVGAGDAFAVGFLHERLTGGTTADALARGADIASRVIGMHGDNAALPYADELGLGSSRVQPGVQR